MITKRDFISATVIFVRRKVLPQFSGLMSASLTSDKTVVGFTENVKNITKSSGCAGTVESVVETETDTDFAHAKGKQRFMVCVFYLFATNSLNFCM